MNAYEKLAGRFEKRLERLIDRYNNEVLLGFVNVYDEEYAYLKSYTRTLLQKYSAETIKGHSECCLIITLALVQIASREASEDSGREFWVVVRDTLDVDYDKALKCKDILYKYLTRDNDLFFYMNGKRHEYVRTVDCHAVIPYISAHKVYNFLYSAYLKDLEEEYDGNSINEYIDIMFEYFRAYINFDDGESDKILSSGIKISKHYMLTKPFRVACLNHKEIMKDFIKKAFFYIDEASFKGMLPDDTELFSKEFVSWWKTKQKDSLCDYDADSLEVYSSK